MAPSFFSRSQAPAPDGPSGTGEPDAPGADLLTEAVSRWRDELAAVTAADQAADGAPRLSLAQAHPGGLAQLYAEHTTRLSNLVREPSAHTRALETAREILRRSRELTSRHGVGPIHLAIGRAQWDEGGVRFSAPAMLRPVLVEEGSDSDILLTLRPGAEISPELGAALAARRIAPDMVALLAEARTVHGFSPSRALATLRAVAAPLPHFDLRDDLVMGIFEHPATVLLRELDHPGTLALSGVVRALAGETAAREELQRSLPEPSPGDRDPWEEPGVGDLTPRQQDVVEAAAAGRSLVIDVPDGGDDTPVLAAILADSGSRGRSTLHVAGSPSRTTRIEASLRGLGLEGMSIRIDGDAHEAQTLRARLSDAMSDTSDVVDPAEVDAMRSQLRRVREALSSYTTYLHRPFERFGASAYDALQVLTDLTGAHPAPRTRVRLREDVLVDVAHDQGERARTLLHRANALGIFSRTSDHHAWSGAVINSAEQVPDILLRVKRLATETLPEMRVQMGAVAGETGIVTATTLAQWEEQLRMLEGVREALDVFRPAVFERSAADMVIATAPKRWRREHGITMRRSQRSRLVKQAKDLVRPGRHVEDLHHELLQVQEKRDVWRRHCDSDGWPRLPQRLDDAATLAASVRVDLDRLSPLLSTSHPDLARMPVTDLARLLDRLDADPEGARELPQRVAVLKALSEAGLEDLASDMRARHVSDDLLDAELDLAWWASALGLMLASEPRLGGFDPARLEGMLEEGRELDVSQVASLTPQALQRLHRLRRQALATRPEQQGDLLAALHSGVSATELVSRHPLVTHLVPVMLTVPTLVPHLVPEGHRIDLVVLDDVDDLPLAELIPLVARARQVVVVADLSRMREGGSVSALTEVLPTTRLQVRPARLNDQVARLLAAHGVEGTGVPVPWTTASSTVEAVWTEGSGMPAPGAAAVESSAAEVEAVVDLVVDLALTDPDRSLAVVALNTLHATRIAQAVARTVETSPGLSAFFGPEAVEPFVVADPTTARGLSRDHVILAVGFAKTPHGRVLHDFGMLSAPRGLSAMADVLRTVRGDLTVVSSIKASELDRSRVSAEGARMLVDLLEVAEGGKGTPPGQWPTLETAPDRLLVDLADRLYGMGLEVVPNVGVPGGMRIPLAIGHPEVPGRLLVAVLTDDQTYVDEPSQRVRDRVWPALLEAQGWKVRTELSMAVFIDPQHEAEEIVQVVLDAVDGINGPIEQAVEIPEDAAVDEPEADPLLDAQVAATDDIRQRLDTLDPLDAGAGSDGGARSGPRSADDSGGGIRADVPRDPRPAIARGLPLAAYGDDQLDELAEWVRSDGAERDEEQMVEELRDALGLTRRGAQSDAVLHNVVRRTAPRP
ncbi:MAG: hypothetical protein L0L69_07075 [Propionibacterium sp.]|nr:hypothetical protein [Propionibacterium sp.]